MPRGGNHVGAVTHWAPQKRSAAHAGARWEPVNLVPGLVAPDPLGTPHSRRGRPRRRFGPLRAVMLGASAAGRLAPYTAAGTVRFFGRDLLVDWQQNCACRNGDGTFRHRPRYVG